MNLNNKSGIFERIKQFAKLKGFKNLNDFSNYVGFKSPEKLYRLGRSEKHKPSYDMLAQISNKFEDLNLNWLIKGTGEITLQNTADPENEVETETNPVADSITNLIQTISATNDNLLRENIERLKQQLYTITESENEIKEKVDYIYSTLLKAELSNDIKKTIGKVKE